MTRQFPCRFPHYAKEVFFVVTYSYRGGRDEADGMNREIGGRSGMKSDLGWWWWFWDDGCSKVAELNRKWPARIWKDFCVWGVRYDRKSFTNVMLFKLDRIFPPFWSDGRSKLAALELEVTSAAARSLNDFRVWGVRYDRKSFTNIVFFKADIISPPFGSDRPS